MISPGDARLMQVTDEPAEVVRIVVEHYESRSARKAAAR
jgi:hypothetical protein